MVGEDKTYIPINIDGNIVHYECPICAKRGEKVMIMNADVSENPPWITKFEGVQNSENNIPYCPICNETPTYNGNDPTIITTHEKESIMMLLG